MTETQSQIMGAVLRYNGVPESDMPQHIEMSRESGRGSLNLHAYRSYRIIWNSWTDEQREKWSKVMQ